MPSQHTWQGEEGVPWVMCSSYTLRDERTVREFASGRGRTAAATCVNIKWYATDNELLSIPCTVRRQTQGYMQVEQQLGISVWHGFLASD